MKRLGVITSIVRRAAGGFVLAFHSIPPDTFAELVESLEGFTIVPLGELVERNKAGRRTAGLFAITVDDGVGENVRGLSSVLIEKNWPATFYLPTAYLDSRHGMAFQWWRGVAPLLPRRPVELNSELLDLSKTDGIQRLERRLEHLWRTQPPENYIPLIDRLIELVEKECGVSREQFQPPAPIGWEEVRQLGQSSLIHFESHGTAHAAVSSMTGSEIEAEMRASRERVEECTGRPCRHFCYPFGSPDSIGDYAPRVAREIYDSAVTMSLGGVDGSDPWLLPRIPIYQENSPVFVHLKVGLTCSPLASAFRTKGDESAARRQTRPQQRAY